MRHGGVDETTIKLFATYLTSGESLMGFSLQVKFTRNLIKCQLYALKDKIVLLHTVHTEQMVVIARQHNIVGGILGCGHAPPPRGGGAPMSNAVT